VDTGLVGCGVEAYLSLTEEVVVLDTKTKQSLWMNPIGAWYRILSFAGAKDADTGQAIQLLRVGGVDGFGRFFEVWTGREKFLELDGETLVARNERRRELRGQPVEVLKPLVRNESKITQPRCERITTKEAWGQLWKEHAGAQAVQPEIDFRQQMVVAIFRGETWNCKGSNFSMHSTAKERWSCLCEGGLPDWAAGDRVCPYGIFIIPKSAKRLIIKVDSQAFIGGPAVWAEIGNFEPPDR
jgi:hypothetical protein